ncbi:MAG: DUF1761 domain-containing protein [Parafilimonas terrae]|nr:DUF1761 domain-containing protein [Parafilimonas terrae]
MSYILDNFVPILGATLAGLLIGAAYARSLGWRVGAIRPRFSVGFAVLAFVAEFWLACILAGALILAPSGQAGPWTMAIGSAVVIWIGFVAPALLVTERFRGLSLRDTLFDCAYWLVAMVAEAAVLHAIGLTHPA